jgi:hypothetical protein
MRCPRERTTNYAKSSLKKKFLRCFFYPRMLNSYESPAVKKLFKNIHKFTNKKNFEEIFRNTKEEISGEILKEREVNNQKSILVAKNRRALASQNPKNKP